jgi:hypothetical protein
MNLIRQPSINRVYSWPTTNPSVPKWLARLCSFRIFAAKKGLSTWGPAYTLSWQSHMRNGIFIEASFWFIPLLSLPIPSYLPCLPPYPLPPPSPCLSPSAICSVKQLHIREVHQTYWAFQSSLIQYVGFQQNYFRLDSLDYISTMD